MVDCSILDGATALTGWIYGQQAAGAWKSERQTNLLDGGAPFYRCYRCSDEQWIAVGAIDAESCRQFLHGLGVAADDPLHAMARQRDRWVETGQRLAVLVASRTRDEWVGMFTDTQACVAPVLSLTEAPLHPQHVANQTFRVAGGIVQPRAVPSFSDTPAPDVRRPAHVGEHTRDVLGEFGIGPDEVAAFIDRGVVR